MAATDLEEGVARFVREVCAGFAARKRPGPWVASEVRAICEEVRTPWRQGGPAMHETRDMMVPTQQGEVRIRLHRPSAPESLPALIYLHGGGFTLFSLDTHDRLMRELAARSGFAVVGVDYALAPEAKFPAAQQQIVAVIRWLGQHGATLGIDPQRIASGGDSAGGNLAFTSALVLREAGEGDLVKGLLSIYGGFGGTISDEIEARYGGAGYMISRDESRFYWNNYLSSPEEAKNPLVAPILAELAGLPPCFLVIAQCDILAEQNETMAERLAEAGVVVESKLYRGASHSFIEAMSVSALAGEAIDDSAAWLKRLFA